MIAKVLCSRKSSTLVRKGVGEGSLGHWSQVDGARGGREGRARGPVLSIPEGQY